MEESYLIQRLEKPAKIDNPFVFGGGYKNGGLTNNAMDLIRPIFAFDYMGAAEFEFGALPKTIQNLAKLNSSLVGKSMAVKTKNNKDAVVYYICESEHEEEVKSRIKAFAKDEWSKECRTKERVGLYDSIEGNFKYCPGWLEIDNGYFFFLDKKMWQRTCELFEVNI